MWQLDGGRNFDGREPGFDADRRVPRHPDLTTNSGPAPFSWRRPFKDSYLVDSASSHMLVSKIKPCKSKFKHINGETANGSLNQL